MAVLKRGSKGNDVQNIQKLLNNAKAKPKLATDGIFGKLTDKQTRIFQKICKLKIDGKVGVATLAALTFGGPVPEMTVQDCTKFLKELNDIRKYHKYLVKSYQSTVEEFAKFAQISAKESALALKMVEENQVYWDKSVGMVHQIVAKQAEFQSVLSKSPGKARKLIQECEVLYKQSSSNYSANIQPNVSKVEATFLAIRQSMKSAQKVLDDQRAANAKVKNAPDLL